MKENKYLTVSLSVMALAIAWGILVTVICVKQDRKVQGLEEQVTKYKDLYHGCLQGKMRLRDQQAAGQGISWVSGTGRFESIQHPVNGTWVFIPNRAVFVTSHNSLTIEP